jgi:hypothetical protein
LPALAKYLYEDICERLNYREDMRYEPTGEADTHPRKEGKLIANDFSGFIPEHKKWGEARDNGRPNILYQYECIDGRKEYKRPTKFECLKDEAGRIYLNPDGFGIRKLNHIPHPVTSVISSWEMEAMSRLNPDIGDLDFSDRMAPVIKERSIPQASRMEVKGERRAKNAFQASEWPPKRNGSQPALFSRSTSATCHAMASSRE